MSARTLANLQAQMQGVMLLLHIPAPAANPQHTLRSCAAIPDLGGLRPMGLWTITYS